MHSKTETIEKPYSKAELKKIEKLFAELRKLSKTKEAKEYVKEVEACLKA
ncbi:MAG TPA: hypothetical protein VFF13_05630 [archaeon]|nr:hypothetical protein [archaeon]